LARSGRIKSAEWLNIVSSSAEVAKYLLTLVGQLPRSRDKAEEWPSKAKDLEYKAKTKAKHLEPKAKAK